MTLNEYCRQIANRLKTVGIDTGGLDARLLIGHALNLSQEELLLQTERILSVDENTRIERLIEERVARKPVAKIIGKKEFYGLEFFTNTHTLDPRPDSETLVDAVLHHLEDRHRAYDILDLGTGTGCLLLTLLARLEKSHGIGVDLSVDALAVAQENAKNLGLTNCADFVQSDWFDAVTGTFDVIIGNPPYIPHDVIDTLAPEVKRHDPRLALDGGKDGLDAYRAILGRAKDFLKPGGWIVFEIGQGQDDAVAALLKKAGFTAIFTEKDLGGIMRVIGAQALPSEQDLL